MCRRIYQVRSLSKLNLDPYNILSIQLVKSYNRVNIVRYSPSRTHQMFVLQPQLHRHRQQRKVLRVLLKQRLLLQAAQPLQQQRLLQ